MTARSPLSSQVRVCALQVLAEADNPMLMDELAQRVGSPKPTVHGVIRRALRAGWVTRSLLPGCLRTYRYMITDKGREWLTTQEGG